MIYLLVQFYGTVIAFIPRTWYMGIGRFWAPLISLFPVGKVAAQNVQAAFPDPEKFAGNCDHVGKTFPYDPPDFLL